MRHISQVSTWWILVAFVALAAMAFVVYRWRHRDRGPAPDPGPTPSGGLTPFSRWFLVVILCMGRSGQLVQAAGIGFAIISHLGLAGGLETALNAATSSSFLGTALGVLWWYYRGGAPRGDGTFRACCLVGGLGQIATIVVWFTSSGLVPVVIVALLQLVVGAATAVAFVTQPAAMSLSTSLPRDLHFITKWELYVYAIFSIMLSTLAVIDGRIALVAAGAAVIALGLAYPLFPQRPAARPAVKAERMRDVWRRPGMPALLVMGSLSFAVDVLAYTYALAIVRNVDLGPLGRTGPVHLAILLSLVAIGAGLIYGAFERHTGPGLPSLVALGWAFLLGGGTLLAVAGVIPGWLRVVTVLMTLAVLECGNTLIYAAVQQVLQEKREPGQTLLLWRALRGGFGSPLAYALTGGAVIAIGVVVLVVMTAIMATTAFLTRRRLAPTVMKGKVSDGPLRIGVIGHGPGQVTLVAKIPETEAPGTEKPGASLQVFPGVYGDDLEINIGIKYRDGEIELVSEENLFVLQLRYLLRPWSRHGFKRRRKVRRTRRVGSLSQLRPWRRRSPTRLLPRRRRSNGRLWRRRVLVDQDNRRVGWLVPVLGAGTTVDVQQLRTPKATESTSDAVIEARLANVLGNERLIDRLKEARVPLREVTGVMWYNLTLPERLREPEVTIRSNRLDISDRPVTEVAA